MGIICSFLNLYNLNITMDPPQKMTQAQIDALLKDSMFGQSELSESKVPAPRREIEESNTYAQDQFQSYQESMVKNSYAAKEPTKREKNVEESYSYANEEFQSYEESRQNVGKNVQKIDPKAKTMQPQKKKLQDIKEETTPMRRSTDKKGSASRQKGTSKTAIYFYPPKQPQAATIPAPDKKNLPYNYARLQQRERELLLTTLSEQNRRLKQDIKTKDTEYQKLQKAYKTVLQEKTHHASSVKEVTLQKQLTSLQSRYDKLQNLIKLQKEKNTFKSTKLSQNFIPEQKVNEREEELLDIIEKLKERLISTDMQLKTLQKKMSEGENYIDQLKRKIKRVEQLQFKMEKMADQGQNDRQYIKHLKQNNVQLEKQLFEVHKQKRLMEVQIRRYQLGQATQTDTLSELKEVKMEKEKLEQNLREVVMNMTNLSKAKGRVQWTGIEDSGELLKP